MKSIISISLSICLVILASCSTQKELYTNQKVIEKKIAAFEKDQIPVLNFGTFHMGTSSDADTTAFDEHNAKNRKEVNAIAKQLAAFKPTVILIEWPPKYQEELETSFAAYKAKPTMKFKQPSEVELLAFELGRIAETKRIYAVDHKQGYNYMKIGGMATEQENETFLNYFSFIDVMQEYENDMTTKDKLKVTNTDFYLDMLIEANADIMTHVATDGNFEGAVEAAKYYERNLKMYTNINRLDLDKDDRVFILMGASHTAFLRDFIKRSPKYKMVNTFDYLK